MILGLFFSDKQCRLGLNRIGTIYMLDIWRKKKVESCKSMSYFIKHGVPRELSARNPLFEL